MRLYPLGTTVLLSLSLGIGCNNGSTSTPADMAAAADMAMLPADMTAPPPDMTQPPPDMSLTFNGCDDASFMDLSASGANRTVTFGGGLGNAYSPKCILINRTQMVTFSGMFSSHPLRAGTVADQNAGTAGSPITSTMAGMTATFTFNTVGTFPYICTIHGAGGMAGVVRVK